jgi:chromosome segregation ATPase
MATPEERLTILEQNVRDINHNETMLLGMAVKQGEQIQEIRLNLASLSERVDLFERSVNSRFDAIDTRLNGVDARLDGVDSHLSNVDSHLNSVDSRLNRMENMLSQILERLPEKP